MEQSVARSYIRDCDTRDNDDMSRSRKHRHRPVNHLKLAYSDPFFGSVFCNVFG